MHTRLTLIIALLTLFVSAGCMTHWVDPDAAPPATRIDGEAIFGYEKADFAVKQTLEEKHDGYDIIRVTFPSYFQDDPSNLEVTAWYYRQHGDAPTAGLIQIPILGGDYGPSMIFAEAFADAGFHVLRFARKNEIFDAATGLHRTRQVMVRSVIDIRRGLDWWLTLPEVDAKRIGVCGISMGGFQGSTLMAIDQRITAGAFLISGGDLADLIMVSEEGEVIAYRRALMALNDWTPAQLEAEAKKVLDPIDPLRFVPNLNPHNVLLLHGRLDAVVPFKHSTALYEAAHRPTRIVLPVGHYSTVFYIVFAIESCIIHFRDVFDIDKPLYPR